MVKPSLTPAVLLDQHGRAASLSLLAIVVIICIGFFWGNYVPCYLPLIATVICSLAMQELGMKWCYPVALTLVHVLFVAWYILSGYPGDRFAIGFLSLGYALLGWMSVAIYTFSVT